jgi:RimJ/RimL family protein N-acetyltransferase
MGQIKTLNFVDRTGKTVTLCTALAEDSHSIIRYIKENQDRFPYMVSTVAEVSQEAKYEKDFIEAHYKRENSVMIIAWCDNRIIGVLNFVGGIKMRVCHDGEIGISVSPEFQGKGIGRKLLETFLRWAELTPVLKRVTLHVMGNNARALNLYRSLGFEAEGRRREAVIFEDGRVEDLIIMGKFLHHDKETRTDSVWTEDKE